MTPTRTLIQNILQNFITTYVNVPASNEAIFFEAILNDFSLDAACRGEQVVTGDPDEHFTIGAPAIRMVNPYPEALIGNEVYRIQFRNWEEGGFVSKTNSSAPKTMYGYRLVNSDAAAVQAYARLSQPISKAASNVYFDIPTPAFNFPISMFSGV